MTVDEAERELQFAVTDYAEAWREGDHTISRKWATYEVKRDQFIEAVREREHARMVRWMAREHAIVIVRPETMAATLEAFDA